MGKWFSKKHIWIEESGENKVKLGLTEYAIKQLRTVMFLNLPDIGDSVEINKAFGDIESIKNVSELISPVSGVVIEVNDALQYEPQLLNKNVLDNWLINVEVIEKTKDVLDESGYETFIGGLR